MNKLYFTLIGFGQPSSDETHDSLIISRPRHEIKDILEVSSRYLSNPSCENAHKFELALGNQFSCIDEDSTNRSIIDTNTETIALTRNSLTNPQKSFFFTGDGKQQQTLKFIQEKNDLFFINITNTDLPPHLIVRAWKKVQLPALCYLFHSIHPSSSFLNRETNRVTILLLPHLGLDRHLPLSILYCPTYRISFALPHLLCEASIIIFKK